MPPWAREEGMGGAGMDCADGPRRASPVLGKRRRQAPDPDLEVISISSSSSSEPLPKRQRMSSAEKKLRLMRARQKIRSAESEYYDLLLEAGVEDMWS